MSILQNKSSKLLLTTLLLSGLVACGTESEQAKTIEQANTNTVKNKPIINKLSTQSYALKNQPQKTAYADDLNILTYNVYLFSKLIAPWSQDIRADMIVQSDIIKGHDVVVLNELFEDKPSAKLLNGIKKEYPYQTPILGRKDSRWNGKYGNYNKVALDDGGVAIVSRYPITEMEYYVYKDGCGLDNLGQKGFVYAKLNKNGADYHVIGTHVQSEDSMCKPSEPAQVRKKQFTELQKFLAKKNISNDEVVFIAGDFNVVKGSKEYPDMLATLKVSEPNSYAGFDSTWDFEGNALPYYNYKDVKNTNSEYLDYIFVSSEYAQPSYWHNQAVDEMSARWENKGKFYYELSDHYPVVAFAYADKNTRTHSYRNINRPYNDIKLKNKGNGAYLNVDKYRKDGWVMVNGQAGEQSTSFNIDNWYPKNNATCIMNNDYVQLKSNLRKNAYLNWWLGGGSGNYAYYTKENDSSDKLRIRILNDDGDCLKNGDEIAFYDTSTVNGKKYFLQRRAYGKDTDKLYLWSKKLGDNETFTIEMAEGKKQDWTSKLNYGK